MHNQPDTVKKILHRLKHYWLGAVISLLMATLYVVMSLYIPVLVGNAIDCIVAPGQVDFSTMAGFLLAGSR